MLVMQTFVVFSGKSAYLEILQRLCVHRAEKGYKHDCLSVSSYTHIRKLNYMINLTNLGVVLDA